MTFNFFGNAELGATQNDNDTTEDASMESQKQASTDTSGITINSGSTNTGKTTTVNSGSTNTANTKTDASTNVVNTSGNTSETVNSGQINTSQLMLSPEAVTHLTNQLLEGTQGLAAVSGGQKAAGGYNATANTLLTNDLLSRVAGEVASRSAMTVNNIGGSTSKTTNSGTTTTQNIGATNSNTTTNVGASTSESDVLNVIGGSSSYTNTHADTMEDIMGVTHSYKMEDKREVKEDAKTGGSFGWIVCTELHRQGRIPSRFYIYGSRAWQRYDDYTKQGYYIWAEPSVRHLRAKPNSLYSSFLHTSLNARSEYLAAEEGCRGARKTVGGFIAKHAFYSLCWILSRTIAKNRVVDKSKFQGASNG